MISLIQYNFRYRGAIEYDKFVLNTLSFYNEIHSLVNDPDFSCLLNNEEGALHSLHKRLESKDSAAMLYYARQFGIDKLRGR